MDNDKNTGLGEPQEQDSDKDGFAQRARNKTVMLTPDATGQLRAQLTGEDSGANGKALPGGFGGAPRPEAGAPKPSAPEAPKVAIDDQSEPVPQVLKRPESLSSSIEPKPPAPTSRPTAAQAGGFGGASQSFSRPTRPAAPSSNAGGAPVQPTPTAPPMSAPVGQRPEAPTPQPQARPAAPTVSSGARVVWTKESPVLGFLVSYDKDENGEVYELRSGRLIITSEEAGSGNYLFLTDETVSPMHAIVRVASDGAIQVLDQLSEHGTKIESAGGKGVKELSGDKGELKHGDVISFGERSFHVCVVVRDKK